MEIKDFNEDLFLSKVDNIFIKFFTAIMLDKLDTVDHFISDDVYEYGKKIIEDHKKDGFKKMYDMLNVKKSSIENIFDKGKYYEIEVFLEARYLDYVISLKDGHIEGNDKERVQVNYNLVFRKNKNVKESDIVKKCPGCGRSIDVNNSGECEYCGAIYNQEEFDWILTEIDEA